VLPEPVGAASTKIGPPPPLARATASEIAACSASRSCPSTDTPGMPQAAARAATLSILVAARKDVVRAYWLFSQCSTTGRSHTEARFTASWNAPVLTAPSPKKREDDLPGPALLGGKAGADRDVHPADSVPPVPVDADGGDHWRFPSLQVLPPDLLVDDQRVVVLEPPEAPGLLQSGVLDGHSRAHTFGAVKAPPTAADQLRARAAVVGTVVARRPHHVRGHPLGDCDQVPSHVRRIRDE
jgi:hypothetical protein